jgi:hypothetical protein
VSKKARVVWVCPLIVALPEATNSGGTSGQRTRSHRAPSASYEAGWVVLALLVTRSASSPERTPSGIG